MDQNRTGISQLNWLIEKNKQLQERSAFKSHYQSHTLQNDTLTTINDYYDTRNYTSQERVPTITGKVYVNPNYTNRKPVIHINPRAQVTPSSIYFNPKVLNEMAKSQSQVQISHNIVENNQSGRHTSNQSKGIVHVNPKYITQLTSKVPEGVQPSQQNHNNAIPNLQFSSNSTSSAIVQSKSITSLRNKNNSSSISIQENSTTSITSNVKKKSITTGTPNHQRKSSVNYIIKSNTKLVKNNNTIKKSPNSSLIAISKRKLVRVRKSPKGTAVCTNTLKSSTPLRKRLSPSGLRKIKISPKSVLRSATQSLKVNNLKLLRATDRHKMNWYKVERTPSKLLCKKKTVMTKKVNDSVDIVSIEGVMYKSSRNQLVRTSSNASQKRRRILLASKNNQYYITKNGKKLSKINITKLKVNNSAVKLNTSAVSPVKNYKTSASNKVKQRSLQIARNKMRKNNQPCLLFQRFGFCANQLSGTCHKVHDKNQVALCRNLLNKGKCLLDNCQLSHNIGPEKMPTCKYFLKGCCIRDGCPYLHVKVSSNNPICVDFLRGYCSQGNECQKRHIHACPEFDKSGKCSKGKSCPYPHKSHLTEIKRFKGNARRKSNPLKVKQPEQIPVKPQTVEYRKRYYDDTSEDLCQKREKLLKQMNIIKDLHEAKSSVSNNEKDNSGSAQQTEIIEMQNCAVGEESLETLRDRPRRPLIGPLPAFIPID